MPTSNPSVQKVEVRTWPERTDLVVIDVPRAVVLAHYRLPTREEPFAPAGPLFDPRASYTERAEQAIAALESDQEYLRTHYMADQPVCLQDDNSCRQRISDLLSEYNLSIEDIDCREINRCVKYLDNLPLEQLFSLLVDWHDVVERHYPRGSSAREPQSWTTRSQPDNSHQFFYLALGEESKSDDPADIGAAYAMFQELIDVPVEDFSFGMLLRWVYFHRAEFSENKRFPLRALEELA